MTSDQQTQLYGITSKSYSSSSAAKNAINNQMAQFNMDNSAIPPTLTFSITDPDHNDVKAVFNNIIGTYEDKIDTWLPTTPLTPPSTERVAFLSLAYNQIDTNPLLGDNLHNAILAGNRANAWYEICYDSNAGSTSDSPPTDAPGIARRRYYEASTFGLYYDNVNTPPVATA